MVTFKIWKLTPPPICIRFHEASRSSSTHRITISITITYISYAFIVSMNDTTLEYAYIQTLYIISNMFFLMIIAPHEPPFTFPRNWCAHMYILSQEYILAYYRDPAYSLAECYFFVVVYASSMFSITIITIYMDVRDISPKLRLSCNCLSYHVSITC